jgi:hypothetical protein
MSSRKARPPKPSPPAPLRLDRGIEKAVHILQANGVETFESCEGGKGHAYPEPTIRFHGGHAEGYRVVTIALHHGLQVSSLRRTWDCLYGGELTGPVWELILSRFSV